MSSLFLTNSDSSSQSWTFPLKLYLSVSKSSHSLPLLTLFKLFELVHRHHKNGLTICPKKTKDHLTTITSRSSRPSKSQSLYPQSGIAPPLQTPSLYSGNTKGLPDLNSTITERINKTKLISGFEFHTLTQHRCFADLVAERV